MPKGIRKTVVLEYKECPTPPIKTGALGFYKSGSGFSGRVKKSLIPKRLSSPTAHSQLEHRFRKVRDFIFFI
jgi:hypothetical protein